MIALAVLACAWIGYFIYCLRDGKQSSSGRRNGSREFSRTLDALGDSVVQVSRPSFVQSGRANRSTLLLDRPRTRNEANRRQVQVIVCLATTALAALAAVPTIGTLGWVIHVVAVTSLLCFVTVASRRRHRSAEQEMTMLMLNHNRPAHAKQQHAAMGQGVGMRQSAVGMSQGGVGMGQGVGIRQGIDVGMGQGGVGMRQGAVLYGHQRSAKR